MPPAWREILRADDIGEHSAGERARLQAHVEELAAEVARLKRQNTSLQREVACQRPAKATDDRIATLARKAAALMSHPAQNADEVYKALAEIRRLAEPEAGNGKPIAISPTTVENLDTAAFRRAMALPASEAQR
jgi:predicted RNase H-like nuclease (RuvC/YqgF family)